MSAIRFIAGSGRSGTTWIQDALAAANKLRPVFEPLHPYLTDIGRRYAHRALSANDEHPELKHYLEGACVGRGPRLWTQYRQQMRWLLPPPEEFWSWRDARRTKIHWVRLVKGFPRMTLDGFRQDPLIKCIRANLMLPWIARQLGSRVTLIVRHPGAVIESELRGGWNAGLALDRFRNDARLHELTQNRYRALLARQLNSVEALTLRWVIENQWVMEAAEGGGIPVFHYEYLRSSPDMEWPRLCSALGLPKVPDDRTLTKPSQQSGTARKSVPLVQSRTPRWMSGLTVKQKSLIRGILEAVGYDGYSMDTPDPLRAKSKDSPVASVGAPQ
jgi:hypothetical protein